MPAPQGWQCPLCEVVHAPSVATCECASRSMRPSGPRINPQPHRLTQSDFFPPPPNFRIYS